jgi:hypothetical protein
LVEDGAIEKFDSEELRAKKMIVFGDVLVCMTDILADSLYEKDMINHLHKSEY